ncbi:DUF4192 family protein [Paenarthrobacter nitroguajacolicus]|uniref:DUF4192 family protein n=1 Tax=Paenarthrobacter nitroguajacolicus TaxID=211146 RepID=UPI003D1DE13B
MVLSAVHEHSEATSLLVILISRSSLSRTSAQQSADAPDPIRKLRLASHALTVRDPADLLSFIGHTPGCWPQESLVCITLDKGKVGATFRIDLPANQEQNFPMRESLAATSPATPARRASSWRFKPQSTANPAKTSICPSAPLNTAESTPTSSTAAAPSNPPTESSSLHRPTKQTTPPPSKTA